MGIFVYSTCFIFYISTADIIQLKSSADTRCTFSEMATIRNIRFQFRILNRDNYALVKLKDSNFLFGAPMGNHIELLAAATETWLALIDWWEHFITLTS